MNEFKKFCKKLIFIPLWLIILLCVVSGAALIFVFVKGIHESPVAYVIYVLAFYSLSTLTVFLALVLPKKYKQIRSAVYATPIGNRYLTDAAFRTHIALYFSLGVNMLYVGLNVFSYFKQNSWWYVILAFYYAVLALMRFLLVRYVRKNGIGNDRMWELRSTVTCSFILLAVNFTLSGAVLMMLYQNRGYNYTGMLIYVMAAYTFYITTHAIVDLVKYRRYKSPVMTMSKVISLCAALVSMLNLETAMFAQFGQDMSAQDKRLMIALTGAGISITVVAMSLYMIIRSLGELKKQKEQ